MFLRCTTCEITASELGLIQKYCTYNVVRNLGFLIELATGFFENAAL
jgi:hypothetical protein